MAEPKDRPILYTLLGLNRAGQILYVVMIFVGFAAFMAWTRLPGFEFTEEDEALFRAARHGDRAGVVRALEGGGSLLHQAPIDRKTALFRAAVFGHADLVRLMLESGAEVDARGADGLTVVEVVQSARAEEKDPSAIKELDAVLAALKDTAGAK